MHTKATIMMIMMIRNAPVQYKWTSIDSIVLLGGTNNRKYTSGLEIQ